MRRVVMVVFGDSWSNARKGYVFAYFYPQDSGSPCRKWSGYSYTSFFQKTVRSWWGEFDGAHDDAVQGAVYASTGGEDAPYPLGECDNASRVVKYVAVLGYRYSSPELVGMRVHDIRVVADLTRHDPTAPDPEEPVAYDGTGSLTSDDFLQSDELLTDAMTRIEVYWTGPWPLLHVVFSYAIDLSAYTGQPDSALSV